MSARNVPFRLQEWGGFGGKLAIPSSEISTPVGATLQAPEEPRGVSVPAVPFLSVTAGGIYYCAAVCWPWCEGMEYGVLRFVILAFLFFSFEVCCSHSGRWC